MTEATPSRISSHHRQSRKAGFGGAAVTNEVTVNERGRWQICATGEVGECGSRQLVSGYLDDAQARPQPSSTMVSNTGDLGRSTKMATCTCKAYQGPHQPAAARRDLTVEIDAALEVIQESQEAAGSHFPIEAWARKSLRPWSGMTNVANRASDIIDQLLRRMGRSGTRKIYFVDKTIGPISGSFDGPSYRLLGPESPRLSCRVNRAQIRQVRSSQLWKQRWQGLWRRWNVRRSVRDDGTFRSRRGFAQWCATVRPA